MRISESVVYVGVHDDKIKLFESQFKVPEGIAYNSYLIKDEKTAVIDSVEFNYGHEWIENIRKAIDGGEPDYLVIQHMEPDHSSSIMMFMREFPECIIVSSEKAFVMMKNFYGTDFPERHIAVSKEGDSLPLGKHELTFVPAPMVHWPEVIVSYESSEKILFSADAFGKFGNAKDTDDWACEARRYYFGIVGKYGTQVQMLLKKLSKYDIKTICPLHGPALTDDLGYYLDLYNTWSSYEPETRGVAIIYSTVYGHTKGASEMLASILEDKGVKVELCDLIHGDPSEAVEAAFRYDRIVLATTTYCSDIFPAMKNFIESISERGFRNRKVALIENGTWAPTAAKIMRDMLSSLKDVSVYDKVVRINSAVVRETAEDIRELGRILSE